MWNTTTTWRTFVTAAAALSLAGCGGGGGGGGDLFEGGTRIELTAGTTTLPVQTGQLVDPISPLYSTTVIAKAYGADGRLVASGTPISFIMDGGNTYSGALYPQPFEFEDVTNPDGSTTKVKKAFWSYDVKSAGGQALMVFHAYNRPGTVKISAAFTDPSTKKTVSKTIQIVVGSAIATGMPATIRGTVTNAPIYVAHQGKNDTALIEILVTDPAGQPIANADGANVKVELLNPEIGAVLQGVNGQQGTIVNTVTTNGVAHLSLKAGTISGTARLRISADAADNNVENGIAQAIIDDISISISDGRIAAISLTGPFMDAVRANATTLPLAPGESFQDGTYLRLLSAVATDNLGNPIPNAEIKFSLIDSPITGFPSTNPSFAISGNDGDPAEGGNRFTAASGNFTGRVLRNDRLILHPNEQSSDRGLISSRIISQVSDARSLLVASPFPSNNGRNSGPAIPWTIGRAQYGVIGASAYTNAQGVASTFLTYPMTRLGQPAMLVAEGDNGVSSVMQVSYIGMQDYSLTASQTDVPAGSSTNVTLCVRDANNAPVPGTTLNVAGTTNNVSVTPASPVTGGNGCANVTINATNYTGTRDVPLTFTAEGTQAQATITVKSQGAGTLFITGATAGANSGTINVRLLDEAGNPIVGRLVTATGTATDNDNPPTAAITSIPPVGNTDNNGNATITVNYVGDAGDTYTINIEAQGGATRTVTLVHP